MTDYIYKLPVKLVSKMDANRTHLIHIFDASVHNNFN